jgi:hypothetical protein
MVKAFKAICHMLCTYILQQQGASVRKMEDDHNMKKAAAIMPQLFAFQNLFKKKNRFFVVCVRKVHL